MNKAARLFYHLAQKEERLLEESRTLEAQQHELLLKDREVQLTKKEAESILRLTKERMENTHILFQTKMENLNTLLSLKEEGWKQKLEFVHHQDSVKDVLHQTQLENLNHVGKVKELLHGEEVNRLNHTIEIKDRNHENERVLDSIDHQRDLFDLDQTIASKMQEIYLMQRDIKEYESRISAKDDHIGILKEQSVLESKRSQLHRDMFSQLTQQTSWKEEYLESFDKLKTKEYQLKEKGIELYYGKQNQDMELRERELEMRKENRKSEMLAERMNNKAFKDNTLASYENMSAEILMKKRKRPSNAVLHTI